MKEPDGQMSGGLNDLPDKAGSAPPRLPAGRHGLPREFVTRNQRERIVTALVDTVTEHGFSAMTVGQITARASVSRRTFYEHFSDKEACFLAAYEMVTEHIKTSARKSGEAHDEWPLQARAATATTVRFLSNEPDLARLLMIESGAAGREMATRHRATLDWFAAHLRSGREVYEGTQPLPKVTEETLIGGAATLIVREISAGRTGRLTDLTEDLVKLTLSPYIGIERAQEVAVTGRSGSDSGAPSAVAPAERD